MEKWVVSAKKAPFQEIAAKFGIDQVTARVIRNRDVIGDEAISAYLHPSMADLHDGALLYGAEEAARLLIQKRDERKKIRIIGDYDIDGVNATYILFNALLRIGADVDYEIPDRMKDGYGLNEKLITLAFEEGADTILTCDNGIAAVEQIRYARELGMTVIVTDHHEPMYEEKNDQRIYQLPPAHVLVDPKLPEDHYPYKGICGAVVAWKVIQVLYRLCGIGEEEWLTFLPYAAFATVGDVMDLTGENRSIVSCGLTALERCTDMGMRALKRACAVENAKLSAYHIGFVLGPCINAGGRLDTAKRSLRLLLSKDPVEAEMLAGELKALNDTRKDLTNTAVIDACELIDTSLLKEDRVLVIYLPSCHESIVGIVAGKIRERYNKPTFVLTDAAQPGMIKGSGRSIENWSMFDGLVKCSELLEKFGGHPMAAGVTLKKTHLDAFRRQLNDTCGLSDEDLVRKIVIDVPMPVSYLREDLINELQLLEPYGKGNEKPVFAQKNLYLRKGSIIGKNRNVLKFLAQSEDGVSIEALYFGDIDRMLTYLAMRFSQTEVNAMLMGKPNSIRISVTYYPDINEFRGMKTLQIVINGYL